MHLSVVRKNYTLRENLAIVFIASMATSIVPIKKYYSPKIIVTTDIPALRIFYDEGDKVLLPHYSAETVLTRPEGYFDIIYSLPSAEIDKLIIKPDLNTYEGTCKIQRITIAGAGHHTLYEFSSDALRDILVPVNHISTITSTQDSLHIAVRGNFPLLGIEFRQPIRKQSIADTVRQYNAEIFFLQLLSQIALCMGIMFSAALAVEKARVY